MMWMRMETEQQRHATRQLARLGEGEMVTSLVVALAHGACLDRLVPTRQFHVCSHCRIDVLRHEFASICCLQIRAD